VKGVSFCILAPLKPVCSLLHPGRKRFRQQEASEGKELMNIVLHKAL
jgi:hypothetical protein